ncbi:MAG: hypothetical protein RL571_1411 [Pseudomonadota bacterium]
MHNELGKDSDRSVAIVAAALVDDVLMQLLSKKLLPAKDVNNCIYSNQSSPLGSFSSRINALHQLGVISGSMHRDLHILRKIRNDFAHEPSDLNFESPAIKSRVLELNKESNYLEKNKIARENVGPQGMRYDFIFGVGWRLYSLSRDIEVIECVPKRLAEFGYCDLGNEA